MSTNVTGHKAPKTIISGRISAVDWYPRKNPKRFTTLVRLPAADEFTTPATVEIVSEKSLGDEGDMVVDLTCTVGGRYRSYPVTDKETVELRTVKTADNSLTAL